MDKNLDFEKLLEQARFLSQLINSGMNDAGETKADEAHGPDRPFDSGAGYAGAFSSLYDDVPVPDAGDNQEIIEKAMQAVKLFQAFNQSGQTSDNASAYDNTSVHNEFTEDSAYTEEAPEETREDGRQQEEYSRIYDETFSTPVIKALKSAIRYIDPTYHKTLGIWIKFLEMRNMLQIYAKRAEDGYGRPEYADWRRGLLLSVRPYVSAEKQYTIDFLVKIIELKEIISMMGEVGNAG